MLGAMCAAVACSKADPEVIIENPAYQIDQNEVYVDMPQKFTYNSDNFLFRDATTAFTYEVLLDKGTPTVEETTFPVTVRLRRALEKDLVVTFTKDDALLAQYTEEKEGLLTFPDEALSGLSFTIPAGATEGTTMITLSKPEGLTDTKGYLSAYALSTDNSELKLSSTLKPLFIKASVAEKPEDPVTLIDAVDPSWVEIPMSGLDFNPKLSPIEGPSGTVNWRILATDESRDLYIRSKSGEELPIEAISVTLAEKRGFKELVIYSGAKEDEYLWTIGTLSFTEHKTELLIRITKPRPVEEVVLGDIVPLNRRVDIKEVKLYYKR